MQLARDCRVGPYRIEGLIASGGMGDVYKAWHGGLERHVAIKTVADHIAIGPEAFRRFSREAKLISSLNHPHICQVYDYIEHEGNPLLVMEYLEGETLSARLKRERPSVQEIARIGAEIADALDCAHRHNLVHRDLKTSNVMLTETGVKVLDFGLVKRTSARRSSSAASSTTTELITEENAFFGTLPFMAPEQVQGEAADIRSDIYSLGVILYVAATGRLPFVRRTEAALASAILHDEPEPVDSLAPSIPPPLARAIDRCLEKNPASRWQSARDLAGELHWITVEGVRRPSRRIRRKSYLVGGGIALVPIAILVAITLAKNRGTNGSSENSGRVIASSMFAPAGVTFPANHQEAVVSPDGERVLLSGIDSAGQSWLWVRPLSEPRVRRIEVALGGHTPFWSSDGRRIGYFRRNELRIVDLAGGPSSSVAPVSLESRGASWNSHDVILYAPQPDSGLFRVNPGSQPEVVTIPDRSRGEIGHHWPHFLPNGDHFLYLVTSSIDSVEGIYLASLSAPAGRRLLSSTSSAWYANGHLLHLRDSTLVAQPFDIEAGQLSGAPVAIATPVASIETLAAFSASTTGVLTYSGGESKDVTELTWKDSVGRTLGIVGEISRYRNPALSRDGRFLAFEAYNATGGDIWTRDLRSNRVARINDPSLQPRNAVWSPDNQSIAFESRRVDGWAIYRWDVNTARSPHVLFVSETAKMPTDWSPDGRLLALAERTRRGDYDITTLDLATGTEDSWFDEPYDEITARFSPSGRLVAYGSNATGNFEIFLERVPSTGSRCRVSVAGGWDPQWGADDGVLFFLDPRGTLMRAGIDPGDECILRAPEPLFETGIDPRTSRNHYTVSPRQDRILLNLRRSDPRAHTVGVLVNWTHLTSIPHN